MRGNPWTRIILVGIGVILMGFPVWQLTHAVAPAEPNAQPEISITETLAVSVTFAHAPESFELSNMGKQILTGAGSAEFHGSWPISLPKKGVDLLFKAKWPMNTPRTAVEVKIETSDHVLVDQTFWAVGTMTELITVLPSKS